MTNSITTPAGSAPGRPAPRTIVAGELTALEALVVIGRTFALLPAAHFEVNGIFPDRISVALHDDLGAFETWRVALGIPAETVAFVAGTTHAWLTATSKRGGATIALTGHGPLPLDDSERGAR